MITTLYYVIELQTPPGAHIVTTKTTQEEALSAFHLIMASASVSNVPHHGAMVVDETMFVLKNELAYRSSIEPEE